MSGEDVEKAPLLHDVRCSTNSSTSRGVDDDAHCSRPGAALTERDALHTSLKSLVGSGLLAMPLVFRIAGVLVSRAEPRSIPARAESCYVHREAPSSACRPLSCAITVVFCSFAARCSFSNVMS